MSCSICGFIDPRPATICSACGTPLPTEDSPSHLLQPGTTLQSGAYTVGNMLGQGGFGITYLADEDRLHRPVAIKEFFPDGCMRQSSTRLSLGRWKALEYCEAKGRFLDEAKTLARFSHPNIVRVHNAFEENGTAYMVMELLEGKTLQQRIEERYPFTEMEAVRIITQAGEALEAVHQARLLHRDIKPDNLILTDDGKVALIDFGTAKDYVAGVTQNHSLTLTPGYAPLEQYAQRARRGPYTDVYALAATLYALLTGEEPVAATDRAAGVELLPPHRVNPKINRAVSDVVLWAMEMRIEQRPQTLREFLNALAKARNPVAPPPSETVRPSPPPLPASPRPKTPPTSAVETPPDLSLELALAGCGIAIVLVAAVVFTLVMAMSFK